MDTSHEHLTPEMLAFAVSLFQRLADYAASHHASSSATRYLRTLAGNFPGDGQLLDLVRCAAEDARAISIPVEPPVQADAQGETHSTVYTATGVEVRLCEIYMAGSHLSHEQIVDLLNRLRVEAAA